MSLESLMSLEGKVAVVTGSSRGIGRAIALYLAQAKAQIVINYKNNVEAAEEALELVRSYGSNGIIVQADASDPNQVEMLIDKAMEHFGHVDILVSNVGSGSAKTAADLDADEYQRVFNTNVLPHVVAVRKVLPSMKERGWGRIIAIASVVGRSGKAFIGTSPAYAGSKGALISYTRSLAREVGPYAITANSICPGWIDWPGKNRKVNPEVREQAIREIPMRRVGSAEDVAGVALFLATDLGQYVNGAAVDVNGGLYMA